MYEIKTYAKAIVAAFAIGVSAATFLGLAAIQTYTVVKIVGGLFG